MPPIAIAPVPPDRLDELEPLWRALYEHQQALTPHLKDRTVAFDRSWSVRRDMEAAWLAAEPESFVLAAELDGRYVGYAFVRVRPGERFAVSWSGSDPLAELATLAVLPDSRGLGIGSSLLDAVDERLRGLGVGDIVIDVITTNVDAMRLYERRGAVPFLTRLVQRIPGQANADRRAPGEATTGIEPV